MSEKFCALLFCGLLTFSLSFAQTEAPKPDFDQAFQLGVETLQKGDPHAALEIFKTLLQEKTNDPTLLTNAGIAASKSGLPGLAISFLRDSLQLNSDAIQTHQAIEFVETQLPVKEIPHNVEFWEIYRANVLNSLPLIPLLCLGAILTLLVGLLLLRWIADRKKAFQDDESLPRLKAIHFIAVSMFAIVMVLGLSKFVDVRQMRATVVPEKISTKSAADSEAPPLFELYAGLEVLVIREQGAWVQVRFPGGPTGWLERSAVRISTVTPFAN